MAAQTLEGYPLGRWANKPCGIRPTRGRTRARLRCGRDGGSYGRGGGPRRGPDSGPLR